MAGKNSSNSSMRQENRIEHGISAMRATWYEPCFVNISGKTGMLAGNQRHACLPCQKGHQTMADGLAEFTLVMRRPCS